MPLAAKNARGLASFCLLARTIDGGEPGQRRQGIASNKLSFLTIILHLSAGFHITTGYTINK
jgi:hypothetical protein